MPRERLGTERGADGVGQVLARRPVEHAEHRIERLLGADVTGGNHGFHAHQRVLIVGALAEFTNAIRPHTPRRRHRIRRDGKAMRATVESRVLGKDGSAPRIGLDRENGTARPFRDLKRILADESTDINEHALPYREERMDVEFRKRINLPLFRGIRQRSQQRIRRDAYDCTCHSAWLVATRGRKRPTWARDRRSDGYDYCGRSSHLDYFELANFTDHHVALWKIQKRVGLKKLVNLIEQ